RAAGDDQSTAAAVQLREARDVALDLAGIAQVDRAQFHPERLRRRLDRAELPGPRRPEGFPQHRGTPDVVRPFLEQLQPFAADRIFEIGEARDVAARTRQVADVAG